MILQAERREQTLGRKNLIIDGLSREQQKCMMMGEKK